MAVDLSLLDPRFQDPLQQFLDMARAKGIELRVVQGLRTPEEQDALYAQGRTAPGPVVTNARGGLSNHNYGLSVDVVPASLIDTENWSPDDPVWNTIGALARQAGLEWGGDWGSPDRPHIQMANADSLRAQGAQGTLSGMAQPTQAQTALPEPVGGQETALSERAPVMPPALSSLALSPAAAVAAQAPQRIAQAVDVTAGLPALNTMDRSQVGEFIRSNYESLSPDQRVALARSIAT